MSLEQTEELRALLLERFGRAPRVCVRTFGCQGNEADSERLRGQFLACGFVESEEAEADLLLFNTCAIRAHAEDRALGNVGRLKTRRVQERDFRVGMCGCVVQQPAVAERLRTHYPFVDLLFGSNAAHRLPELLYELYHTGKRVIALEDDSFIHEEVPVQRGSSYRAWLPVMYGCDNFCSYCIVPYVRGRERSRRPDVVLEEARNLIHSGYREITLLGQNVNSYTSNAYSFPRLLRELDEIPGDYWLRFMTSHPKDCTNELLDVMASGAHIARHLHLPVQSGNDRILQEMNRRHSAERYRQISFYAKNLLPDLALTSDIIVGFPGETDAEFQDTLRLVEAVRFRSLFTFLFSPREGTRAASLPNQIEHSIKVQRLQELTALQERISLEETTLRLGQTVRVLCEGAGKQRPLTGRTSDGRLVEFDGTPDLEGTFQTLLITQVQKLLLFGELKK